LFPFDSALPPFYHYKQHISPKQIVLASAAITDPTN